MISMESWRLELNTTEPLPEGAEASHLGLELETEPVI